MYYRRQTVCLSAAAVRTLLVPSLRVGPVAVSGEEAHHALHVLRLRTGEAVRLADGAGLEATARVTLAGRHHIAFEVAEVRQLSPAQLSMVTVVLAPPKGDRWGAVVRSLTELGVGALQPLNTERGGSATVDTDRTLRIMAEALKQSRRGWLPALLAPTEISAVAELATRGATRIVFGDLEGGRACPAQTPQPTILLVGPEGGLSDRERRDLLAAGAVPVRFAAPVLRIETAAVAAAAVWAAAWDSTPGPASATGSASDDSQEVGL